MITKYALIAAGVVAAAALAGAGVQTLRLKAANASLSEANAEVNRLKDAAAGSERTIQTLQGSLTAIQAEGDRQAAAAAAAAERAVRAAAERDRARAALDAAKRTDYAKPDCAALLALDLASVCPAHADSLRKRAGGLSR